MRASALLLLFCAAGIAQAAMVEFIGMNLTVPANTPITSISQLSGSVFQSAAMPTDTCVSLPSQTGTSTIINCPVSPGGNISVVQYNSTDCSGAGTVVRTMALQPNIPYQPPTQAGAPNFLIFVECSGAAVMPAVVGSKYLVIPGMLGMGPNGPGPKGVTCPANGESALYLGMAGLILDTGATACMPPAGGNGMGGEMPYLHCNADGSGVLNVCTNAPQPVAQVPMAAAPLCGISQEAVKFVGHPLPYQLRC
jgi:hypothetical protein